MELHLIELTTKEEMLAQYDVMLHLYTNFTYEKYDAYLTDMIPHNYKQIAVFERDVCVGLSGLWSGTKLWSGKYLEIDNFIVHPDHRKKGIGKMMTDYVDAKAKELGCTMIVLDAFTGNFNAHRFYYNQGYAPKGFHFLKIINEDGLS
ncbi:GNAT family N-acetyltransferase [Flavobacterium sp. F-328]|uniref:GNAT family N-acetyltransferase n=1 Tax=Flavobacterium erciyesense TaxID=2825842 RepID=A0ABS5D6C8_9FLAO|nr:GNAT family N-acetyltransferase [Flavobacterium erciyesense]MBQ0909500.1 GNAT family N-acetyltransferase [Flavobacterium erciyesense]